MDVTEGWKDGRKRYYIPSQLRWRGDNKGLRRGKHDMTAACGQEKVEQVYIKSLCGHRIVLDTINC